MVHLKPSRIICIGDVMLDRFIYGQVERISPESPIPILHIQKNLDMLGGAGNVARNLVSLGGKVDFISLIGDDAEAKVIETLFTKEPEIQAVLFSENNHVTTVKSRFIAQAQQLLRVDREKIGGVCERTQKNILLEIEKKLPTADAIILSDYAKGLLIPNLVQSIIQLCQGKVPIMIDPKGRTYEHYRGGTFLSPNLKELKDVTYSPIRSQEEVIHAAHQLRKKYDIENILITQGQEGMTLVNHKLAFHIPTHAREVYDVSGAGDTVIAALTVALTSGNTVETSCRLANIAAGLVVGKVGTATVNQHELINAYQSTHEQCADKIYTRPALLSRIEEWRKLGYQIGFTNGCFDLLHLGHIHILRSAAAECDRLIVGLNTDQSVRRLKGQNRPIHDEKTRAEVLASLYMVDGVVLFDQDTPLELIETIQPDVLIKGSDYTMDRVVGADIVMKRGGNVKLIDLKPGHSTTHTIAKRKM